MNSHSPISTRPKNEAPQGWKWRSLTEVARLESHTPSRRVAAYWESGNVPWLSLKDIRNLSSKYVFDTTDKPTPLGIRHSSARILPRGTVALCRTASVGKAAVLGVDMATSQDFVNWVCGDEIWPEYLYWAFQSSQSTFELEKQGSTHQTMYIPTVERFQILLPPVAEQQRITAILDKADALRAKRRAALAQLDILTRSMFLDMFGDPATNPNRWPLRLVSDYVADFEGGKSIDREVGEGAMTRNRVLKVSAVTGMRFLAHESKPVPDSYVPPQEHFVRQGDLLFSRANTSELVGAVAYVDAAPPNVLMPDKLWRFVWQASCPTDPLFVWALFQTQIVRYEVGRRATGTSGSMKNISQQKLFDIMTIFPPLHLQRRFSERLAAARRASEVGLASAREFDALFASLQYRAFRGEL